MSILPLALARQLVLAACQEQGVELVTPESPSLVRSAVYLTITAATSLTYAQAQAQVSVYVPELVADAASLLALAHLESPIKSAFIVVSQLVWDDADLLLGVVSHELGHHRRDEATRKAGGIIGSVLWGSSYLAHPMIRGWEEATCYQCDVTADVVLRGADPVEAGERAMEALASIYHLDPEALALAHDAIRSAVASLLAGELPGKDTSIHAMLVRVVHAGGQLPPLWASAIGAGGSVQP